MSRLATYRETVTTTNAVTTSTSTPFKVNKAKTLSVQAIVDVNTPAAKTFTDGSVTVATDVIAIASHGFTTGLKGQLTTDGVLPTGLSGATDYFVISVDANSIKLASSLANAQAGTAVNITAAAGGGTHTFTPTSLAGASLTLQKSNNYNPITGTGDFDAVETATSITTDANIWISDVDPEYEWCRLSFTLTAGRLSATSYILVKEDV